MKRIIISICIIAAIIAIGVSAISYIDAQNTKLYGKIEMVINSYRSASEDTPGKISELEDCFSKYAKTLSCFVGEDMLNSMAVSVSRLMPMYESGSDELYAECETIKEYASAIYRNELPVWYRIL